VLAWIFTTDHFLFIPCPKLGSYFMKPHCAEIIAIGDEITSGVRLDTNTQWISSKLETIGIRTAFHSSVGDQIAEIVSVFKTAISRADIVICTGGLGPTADDLTRQAIAEMAGVGLIEDIAVLEHIESMYRSRGREMPPNNKVQALFPTGANKIDNPEGTAPGIDFSSQTETSNSEVKDYRVFALPGVPVEMKQMWERTVEPELRILANDDSVIHHHTIHCFGSGESHIESLLPDIIQRGRDPQVGITASSATISLRISTRGDSVEHCLEKMQPTIKVIHDTLGQFAYGANGVELEEVVVGLLLEQNKTLAIHDAGLNSEVANRIKNADSEGRAFKNEESVERTANVHLKIGEIDRDIATVDAGDSFYQVEISDETGDHAKEFRFSGHSGWREVRATKEVLNYLRLHLMK
jgi:nicotinamide-nucleotide amidase